jgi:putative tricarboxylic transport membrane protein
LKSRIKRIRRRVGGIWLFTWIIYQKYEATLFCLIGAFSAEGKTSDAFVVIIFGVVGYLLKKFDYEPACLIFALVLGPMFETAAG